MNVLCFGFIFNLVSALLLFLLLPLISLMKGLLQQSQHLTCSLSLLPFLVLLLVAQGSSPSPLGVWEAPISWRLSSCYLPFIITLGVQTEREFLI